MIEAYGHYQGAEMSPSSELFGSYASILRQNIPCSGRNSKKSSIASSVTGKPPKGSSVRSQITKLLNVPQFKLGSRSGGQQTTPMNNSMNKSSNRGNPILRMDLLMWFQMKELSPDGSYLAVPIDQADSSCNVPPADQQAFKSVTSVSSGTFVLRHGMQRRLSITICQEQGTELVFKNVKELKVCRIRNTPDIPTGYNFESDENEDPEALSLKVFNQHYISKSENGKGQNQFLIEANWDSSMHNSALLNRISHSRESIYITVVCHMEIEKCVYPICFYKDLCVTIQARDKMFNLKSLKSWISTNATGVKVEDPTKISGVYQLSFYSKDQVRRHFARHRQTMKIDSPATEKEPYVRGEENLGGWRPRRNSLILEHLQEVDKLGRLEMVEKVRHVLNVRKALGEKSRLDDIKKLTCHLACTLGMCAGEKASPQ